ncbi:ThiF family adenylyltransferase [Rossellomorea aquimaris]|uniref:ThiF family adenylyltransferase n=1 Tax=Rossellomorea aquimaris TaxID=189382 RepID=UPI0011E8C7F6|nr:ThiF family adenylyltransferase [Rossellomorea aquimaris]TYS83520.1 ThiF family adenylyltransferase [Rossellomorea aquimaris]
MDYKTKYKLKDTYFISTNENRIQFGDEPGFSFEIEDDTGFFKEFIEKLNGENSVLDIKAQLSSKYPEITEQFIEEVIQDLDKNFLITIDRPEEMVTEARHVSNLNFFENFSNIESNSKALLNRIRNIKVGIIGLGGLGSTLLTQLAGIGCSDIYVIEPDSVEEKNLNRQFLYKTKDIGRSKATVAKENIYSLNPDIKVSTKILEVTSTQDLINNLPNDIDLLICAADQPLLKIQLWCNQYCLIKNIPLITGGLGCTQGHFLTIIPEETPCLECFYHNLIKDNHVKNTLKQLMNFNNKNAALGNSINLIASSIMTEIIRMFSLKLPPISLGRRVFIDFINLSYNYEDSWVKEEACNCNKKNSLPLKTILEEMEGDLIEI